ncbi:glycohydrolase toxin TNT-related protein [Actinophytocola sp.]|uniref:glycohydrolase toxin TNT-related protein n=1 Tax=Actinophytocola sp. TaxID=1872138 RepID=UPI00389B01F1
MRPGTPVGPTGSRPEGATQPDAGPAPDRTSANRPSAQPDVSRSTDDVSRAPEDTTPKPDSDKPATSDPKPDTDSKADTDSRPNTDAKSDTEPKPDSATPDDNKTDSSKPDEAKTDSDKNDSPKPDDGKTDDGNTDDGKTDIHGEDSDGPTPDDDPTDKPDDAADDGSSADGADSDTGDAGTPPVSGEPADGPPVDENGVPLNFLGNKQGEHPYADMGDYTPMGGDRTNGMGSYDQRVAPLIADHNPWGVHGSREEFNANHRPDGTYRTNQWPPNDGAVEGSERHVTLPEGTVLDRFGGENGRFLSPMDTDGTPYHYSERAIFPDNAEVGYHVYVVADPSGLPGTLADVAPALGQPGGGRQFTLNDDVNVQRLLAEGVIREVHVPPDNGRVLPDSFGQDGGDGTQHNDTVSVDDARDGADHTDHLDHTGSDHTEGGDNDASSQEGDSTPPLPDHLQQVADNSAFRTPAGAALFDPSDIRTRDAASAVAPIDGHFILDVHSDGQHAYVNGQQLNGRDLANLARDLGWNGTDPIILNGCEAGRHDNGLAADLARESGARVIAPTERSWSGQQNTTPYSASADHVDDRGRARPTHPPDGGWRAFDGDGTVSDTGRNGLPVDNRPGSPTAPTQTPPGAPTDSTSHTPTDSPSPTPTDPTHAPTDSTSQPATDPPTGATTHSPTDPTHSPTGPTHSPNDPTHPPAGSTSHPTTDPTHPPTDPSHQSTDSASHPATNRPVDPTHSPNDSTHPPTGSTSDPTTDSTHPPADASDTQNPSGAPGEGPPPAPGPEHGTPLPFGDDVDRGRVQSPFVPPRVDNADDPVTIRVDDDAASTADPTDANRPLRSGERLIGRTGLEPNTAYHVPGRGTYYTNDAGVISHADLEVNNRTEGIHESGANENPDASYPQPNTTYRVDVDGAEHIYTTDAAGLPPRYREWTTPPHDNTVTFPSTDTSLPADHPLRRPLDQPPRGIGEALSSRTSYPPHTEIVHNTPNGTTRLYTGAPGPDGTARVVAIDTWSSRSATGSGNVRVGELNPELNNFPPNVVTRINGEDVYITNDHGVSTEATDERDYSQSAPRSGKAQTLVKREGGSVDVDGGHIRPTQAGGHVDARNQFPQLSAENRSLGGPADQIWWGQDMAAEREQRTHGSDHLWHDLQTEGATPGAPARPQQVHQRFVMRDSHGRIRIHFRRYDN